MSKDKNVYETLAEKIRDYEKELKENYEQMERTQIFYVQGICAGLRIAYREIENIDSD